MIRSGFASLSSVQLLGSRTHLNMSSSTIDANSSTKKKSAKRLSLFDKPVDVSKVNEKVMREWIATTLQEQLPDDDITVEFVCELLFGGDQPDIAVIREQMTDFLGELDSKKFCAELWKLLLSAQSDKDGIPEQLLAKRKQHMKQGEKTQEREGRRDQSENAHAELQAKNMLKEMHLKRKLLNKRTLRPEPKPATDSRVSKPSSKTNYNRSSNGERKSKSRPSTLL